MMVLSCYTLSYPQRKGTFFRFYFYSHQKKKERESKRNNILPGRTKVRRNVLFCLWISTCSPRSTEKQLCLTNSSSSSRVRKSVRPHRPCASIVSCWFTETLSEINPRLYSQGGRNHKYSLYLRRLGRCSHLHFIH